MMTGEGVYMEWQSRVCHYWYKKMKDAHPDSAMGGFTRLLHTGKADDFMHEIPTVVVDALPAEMETAAKDYAVIMGQAYGLEQFVRDHLHTITDDYILTVDPDSVFMEPPPLWATPTKAAAFYFPYVDPQAEENARILQKYNDKGVPLTSFASIGEV
jgi:hypothetical protein